MARTDNLTNYLTDVADSIRTKTGKNGLIPAAKFDEEIESIATDTTAKSNEILDGKTAYIDGEKVTGSYPISYKNITVSVDDQGNAELDTDIGANMRLFPTGNTSQEVIEAEAGTTVERN